MTGTTASQVRQDFNCFGGFRPATGIGYKVDVLRAEIGKLARLATAKSCPPS